MCSIYANIRWVPSFLLWCRLSLQITSSSSHFGTNGAKVPWPRPSTSCGKASRVRQVLLGFLHRALLLIKSFSATLQPIKITENWMYIFSENDDTRDSFGILRHSLNYFEELTIPFCTQQLFFI